MINLLIPLTHSCLLYELKFKCKYSDGLELLAVHQ
jgi:hypothetical protein